MNKEWHKMSSALKAKVNNRVEMRNDYYLIAHNRDWLPMKLKIQNFVYASILSREFQQSRRVYARDK
jgi:hypothetical protein